MNKKTLIIGGLILTAVAVGGFIWYKKNKAVAATPAVTPKTSPAAVVHASLSEDPKVQHIIDQIKGDAKWLADVTAKAKANGVTLDNQLVADAKWMIANP